MLQAHCLLFDILIKKTLQNEQLMVVFGAGAHDLIVSKGVKPAIKLITLIFGFVGYAEPT